MQKRLIPPLKQLIFFIVFSKHLITSGNSIHLFGFKKSIIISHVNPPYSLTKINDLYCSSLNNKSLNKLQYFRELYKRKRNMCAPEIKTVQSTNAFVVDVNIADSKSVSPSVWLRKVISRASF